jgi:DNA repair exonuclease SbcCD nuclease subunit
MSDEVLLFSDLHCHCHKRKNERLEDCLKVLNWVFDTAEDKGIENILFGGDFYHDRQKIDVYTYQKAFEVLEKRLKSNRFKLYLLLGNHDLWYNENTSVSSTIPLSSLPGIKIISKPERINISGCNWDFIPFTHNPIASLEDLNQSPGNPEYALGHIAIDGAILHGSQHSEVSVEHDGDMISISPSIFSRYKHTFLGHYHAAQKINSNVEYIGSPLQLSFGEMFQDKHIIVFNGSTGKKDYILNSFSPVHLYLDANDIDKHNLDGNFVKIKVDDIGSTDLVALRKKINDSNNLASLEIKQQKKPIEDHLIQDAKAILYNGSLMFSKYVDEVGCNGLDRDKLLQFGQKICQKTN